MHETWRRKSNLQKNLEKPFTPFTSTDLTDSSQNSLEYDHFDKELPFTCAISSTAVKLGCSKLSSFCFFDKFWTCKNPQKISFLLQ